MGLPDYGETYKGPHRDPRFDKQTAPVRSLNEAWLAVLDRCAVDTPLSGVVFPLMRLCFFCGATHAVFLLDNGHGAQLAADIAGYLSEEPRS
jgi:hypothetical protein